MGTPQGLTFGEPIHQAWHKPESDATFAGIYQGEPVVIKRGGSDLHREEVVLRAVDYKGIPKVLGYFEENKLDHLVMEQLSGVPLSKLIELDGGWHSKVLPISEVVRIVDGLALCFGALHKAGYMYRDLNFDHVMVGDSVIGLLDYEWCVASDDSGSGRIDSRAGTWETMAPEEFEVGNIMTPASNVYTLGVVLLQLVTGNSPFNVSSEEIPDSADQRSRSRQLHERLPEIQNSNPRLDTVLVRALQPKPEDRYQTVEEFQKALELL